MGRGLFSTTRDRVRVRVRVRAATEIVAFSRFGCDNPGVRAAFFFIRVRVLLGAFCKNVRVFLGAFCKNG